MSRITGMLSNQSTNGAISMDKKLILDLIASSFILLFIIGPRFNTWGQDAKVMFSGKPNEYIDKIRFFYFSGIYLLTYIVLAIVIHNFPELMEFFPISATESELSNSVKEVFGQGSYALSLMILTMLLNNSKVSSYEESWRNFLHAWARIPKSVEEIKDAISQDDCFFPSQKYIELALNEIKLETESTSHSLVLREYWEKAIQDWEKEKAERSANWSFIKCLFLILIIRDLHGPFNGTDLKLKADRIRDLGKILPFIKDDDTNLDQQKNELNALSLLFIEFISKHVVKKYPTKQAQHTTFKNLGFNITYHDTAETKIFEAISYSVLGVLLINSISTWFIVSTLGRTQSFSQWAFGGFVAICLSLFVGVFAQKVNASKQREASIPVYVLTLVISTTAALIYFNWGSGAPNTLGRIILALSFSTISVIVFRSLEDINHDTQEVRKSVLAHALGLAIIMAILQVSITLSYTYSKCPQDCETAILTKINSEFPLMLKLAAIGFFKGFFLGGLISYLIQDSIRRQQLIALRRTPRVKFNQILTLENGANQRRVDTRNLSKNGTMIKCECDLQAGDEIYVSAPFLGKIKGIIRWTHPRSRGKQLTGIEFTDQRQELFDFLRQQYGEFYA